MFPIAVTHARIGRLYSWVAALLRDGEIVAAASGERFTRKKGDSDFPSKAVEFCLKRGGITNQDLPFVGFYDKPLLKFERILETYLGTAPRDTPAASSSRLCSCSANGYWISQPSSA